MTSEHYMQAVVDGKDDNGKYIVKGLKQNGQEDEYRAQALNINGYSFATNTMEIGEYDQTVLIEQDVDGGYLNFIIDKN